VGRRALHDPEILECRRTGLTTRQTAEQLGISTETVCACMRRHEMGDSIRTYNHHKKKTARKPPFSILIMREKEVFKVLPTSRRQFDNLLALLQREGGEII